MITQTVKKCFHCKEMKDVQCFTKNNYSKDGLQNGCRPCKATIQATYRKTHRLVSRQTALRSDLKRKYGLTIEQWQKMFNEQNGRCKICQKHQSKLKSPLCVDHDHTTGKVRGLLCPSCNHRLIAFDDKVFCAKATLYLQGLL